MSDKNILLPLVEKFFDTDMEAASRIFESLPEDDVADVFQSLPPALAVRMIKHLQISFAAALLKDADEQFLREVVSGLDPQLAASILMHLPSDVRERVTKQVTGKLKTQIREFLEYPENSVGRIMTTDFLSFSIKKRLPWLYVNLATAFLAAAVVALFEGIIAFLGFAVLFQSYLI